MHACIAPPIETRLKTIKKTSSKTYMLARHVMTHEFMILFLIFFFLSMIHVVIYVKTLIIKSCIIRSKEYLFFSWNTPNNAWYIGKNQVNVWKNEHKLNHQVIKNFKITWKVPFVRVNAKFNNMIKANILSTTLKFGSITCNRFHYLKILK